MIVCKTEEDFLTVLTCSNLLWNIMFNGILLVHEVSDFVLSIKTPLNIIFKLANYFLGRRVLCALETAF